MWPDGICRVTDTRYTKTIQYQDINYQLSQNEDKTAIFEAWCDFLNYFDSSVQFQLSFVNLSASQETFARSISIPPCGDEFDGIRAEYAGMLQNQLARGNNGLIKTKYLTFGVEADNLRAAKPRLERIETDLLNNFKRLGVVTAPLNGFERLHVMHDILRMDEQEPFRFSWDWLPPSGLSTKDFIAPSSFEFKTGRMFRMGKKLGAISFVQILAPELNDRMLADFLDMESSVLVNLHVQSVDQVNAIKTVKRKITDLDKSKIEEQKKAVRAGYDMDIIPSDLATYGAEAKKLLQDLQSRNERMFLLTFLILNTADTSRQLDNNIFQTSSIAQKYNCALTRLDFQQEEGLMSSLPLGLNQIEIQRGLTTSSVAIFVPFTTQELFQNGGETLYYGLNALSNNLIMVDRKKLKNPNGLILGTPGSGKSFSAKREITNAFLVTDDDIIICDPEAEYAALQWLFEQQYELTLTEVVEIRTRTTSSTDPETGETTTEEEDYEYYILNVKLRNKGLNSVISNSGLSEDDMERYRILLQTRGNRPDIFGNDIYATPGGEYTDYDIPGEALTDTRFANMIREAEKYLGYPYVWGGSSPSTSFDCSGFVSYVINHCGNGWSVGRLTANGLMGVCDIIPKSSAKPGDLIFFQGTYDTSGASHVGIYVGNGMMIHCGNPISYASIESNYWQQHFYCFGRIRN